MTNIDRTAIIETLREQEFYVKKVSPRRYSKVKTRIIDGGLITKAKRDALNKAKEDLQNAVNLEELKTASLEYMGHMEDVLMGKLYE